MADKLHAGRLLLLGIDCGGTSMRIACSSSDGGLTVGLYPGSVKYTDIGTGSSAERIAETIREQFELDTTEKLSIVISMSGASNREKNNEFVSLLARHFAEKDIRVHIESDSTFTLRSAYPNRESGYLVIAGTGSVVLARDRFGNIHKAGGWGRMLGDEGGGYWLGLQALKYYVHALDGDEEKGMLFERIEQHLHELGLPDFYTTRKALYANDLVLPAQFAPDVFDTKDDIESRNILNEGIAALIRMIGIVRKKANGHVDTIITLHGSVATNPFYAQLFEEEAGKEFTLRTISTEQVLAGAIREANDQL